MNTVNLNFFPNHGGIYRFERKSNKNSRERKSLTESVEIWGVSFRLILKDYGGNRHCVRLPNSWSWTGGWCYLKKRRQENKGHIGFEIGVDNLLHTCIGGWTKLHAELVCFFIAFLVETTRTAIKGSLDLYFHLLTIEFFWLA